uniref:E3 ubiquitin-protein ligase n=1 Tax=Clastoptera arizonana TaxID=38151 RepID=A0A1B6EDU8_9HEMI
MAESNLRRRSTRIKKKQEREVIVIDLSNSSSSSLESEIEADGISKTNETAVFDNPKQSTVECAVCLQVCVHPAKLPCGHIFCFLCLKGIANQSKKCAMCRQEIPSDYLDKPDLVTIPGEVAREETFEDGYQWFYEGRNGWWQYDERTSRELESGFKAGHKTCELLIAGFLYIADFELMVQFRRYEPARRRRMKRDLATIPKKGIAGIRAPDQPIDAALQQLNSLTINDEQTVPSTSNED